MVVYSFDCEISLSSSSEHPASYPLSPSGPFPHTKSSPFSPSWFVPVCTQYSSGQSTMRDKLIGLLSFTTKIGLS
ncbi:Uncharacterized protein APZ42_009466 [Daphnia magna]|uniref:Uncharacterized protein n=1 Tax=Daphnia magna TaxID=35525 RepID=A0A162CYS1_9CRUS|nr:Uncharacterized protein APZ42_009466 [Daphnia magna]